METNITISRTLLIVPPFASIYRPSLGVHVLQSVARTRGLQVDVLYANLIFASLLGEAEYDAICEHPFMDFLGERIMGWFAGHMQAPDLTAFNQTYSPQPPLDTTQLLVALKAWREQVMRQIRNQPCPYACVGVSSTFEQTNACLILLRACRQALPDCTLIIGGANCEGPMAEGMAAYIPEVDYVFSGESELVFADFLADMYTNQTAYLGRKIIHSPPNEAVNDLPPNDFAEYFQQFTALLPNSPKRSQLELPYESSRGCWWGQKHHCTFCGLNGQGMGFREKNPDKVFDEIIALKSNYQSNGQATRILMADNIMPHSYFNTLLPRLAQARTGLYVFYEQKANIDLEKAILLKQAGIEAIQPGIEALHSGALKLMKKGVSAKQNITLLRYARALNIHVIWNYLYGFPGEKLAWFAELLQHLPALVHLQPPTGLHPINIDRFSPFFSTPKEYGFSNVQPHPAYREIFSPSANPAQMAYHFCGDSNTLTLTDSPLLGELRAMITRWQQYSQQTTPKLLVLESGEGEYLLIDSRNLPSAQPGQGGQTGQAGQANIITQTITAAQAAVCLAEHHTASATTDWALQQRTAIAYDGCFLPLAIAEPQLMLRFERAAHRQKKSTPPCTPSTPITSTASWTAIKVSAR